MSPGSALIILYVLVLLAFAWTYSHIVSLHVDTCRLPATPIYLTLIAHNLEGEK